MSLTEAVYLRLPIPLKQAALSYYGRKLEQLRYATAEQDEREWGMEVLAGRSWPELRELQNQRLAALVQRARQYSPFWTQRLSGLTIENEADLQQLPTLSKQELRRAGRSVVCTDISPRDVVQEQTSGSTGSPMTYYLSVSTIRHCYVLYRSFRHSLGLRPGQRRARFGGRLIFPYSHSRPPYWLFDRAQDTIYLSLLHMSEETLPRYAQAVVEYGPAEISGYPSSIYLLADWCLRHKEDRVRPQRILTDSETLLEHQRETIEKAFNCQVTNCYGLSETGGMFAGECRSGTFHIFPQMALVEVLDEEGRGCSPGQVGTIHVTSLVNDGAPQIRYNTGDLGALGPVGCACGLQTPTFASLEGRVDDVVTTADGRRVGRLDHIFKVKGASGQIRECQIVQLAPGRFRFLIVPGDEFGPATLERTRADAQSRLGVGSEISLEVVDQIPRGPNGKFRAVVVLKN